MGVSGGASSSHALFPPQFTPAHLPSHTLSPPLTLSRTVSPSIHSAEGETVCKREGEWEWRVRVCERECEWE